MVSPARPGPVARQHNNMPTAIAQGNQLKADVKPRYFCMTFAGSAAAQFAPEGRRLAATPVGAYANSPWRRLEIRVRLMTVPLRSCRTPCGPGTEACRPVGHEAVPDGPRRGSC